MGILAKELTPPPSVNSVNMTDRKRVNLSNNLSKLTILNHDGDSESVFTHVTNGIGATTSKQPDKGKIEVSVYRTLHEFLHFIAVSFHANMNRMMGDSSENKPFLKTYLNEDNEFIKLLVESDAHQCLINSKNIDIVNKLKCDEDKVKYYRSRVKITDVNLLMGLE